ncbi:MAG: hypothetical protein CR986_03165 [Ignavibacteriae bacterium]|nr:MAG: hypothetical protein CR986_03165 [Ignavibacteriota bacterium]
MQTKLIKFLSGIILSIGIALFILVKFYLRKLNFENNIIVFILGIAPNFLFALFTSTALASEYFRIKKQKREKFDRDYKLLLVGIFLILILEEFFPFFSGSKVTDIYDIFASLVGILIGYLFYSIIIKRY